MIINTEQSNVQLLGDIKEFKTSIDPKNLEFIITLLSSNLYSDPEQSFIREIVSNAWDSHVEAGTTDTPVIIRFNNGDNGWEVTIRDFGTGLSPERFQEIWCNIGSSTKRESNKFIGGFGIGRFSALACSNTVYITSYYEGVAYIYVMVKSGNCITTNLVMKKPTEEKNGVEVSIKNIKAIYAYKRALKYIIFFPNVYVDGILNEINSTKVKRFNNFAAASIRIDTKILLGNVLYPCDYSMLSWNSRTFIHGIEDTGIVIKFDIGELSITPNRESIIYNKETIEKIEERIEAARNELNGMAKKILVKDYDNLYEYWKVVSRGSIEYFPISNSYNTDKNYNRFGYSMVVNPEDLTFKGTKNLNDIYNVLRIFFTLTHINFKGLFYSGKCYQNKIPRHMLSRAVMSAEKVLMLTGNTKLTDVAKEWLKSNYEDYIVVTKFTKYDLKSYLFDNIYTFKDTPNVDIIIEYMYDYLMSKITPLDIYNNTDFQEYKATIKDAKVPTVKIKSFILHIQRSINYTERVYFKNVSDCITYIKRLKKGIILADMQDSDIWYDVSRARGFMFIRARKEIVEYFNKIKPSFLVDKKWLLTEDPVIVKLHTICQTFDSITYCVIYDNYEMLQTVPAPLKDAFIKIISFYQRYAGNSNYRNLAETKCTKIDPYTDYLCKKLKRYYDIYKKVSVEAGINNEKQSSLIRIITAALIVKNKAYRINYESYNAVKNNKLLRLLCRKK